MGETEATLSYRILPMNLKLFIRPITDEGSVTEKFCEQLDAKAERSDRSYQVLADAEQSIKKAPYVSQPLQKTISLPFYNIEIVTKPQLYSCVLVKIVWRFYGRPFIEYACQLRHELYIVKVNLIKLAPLNEGYLVVELALIDDCRVKVW